MAYVKQIVLQNFLNLSAEIEAIIGKTEKKADIQGHLKKGVAILLNPFDMTVLITIVYRISELIRCRVKVISDIPMCDMCFTDGLQMDGANFITIDLRKDLPIRDAELLPLGFRTFWTVTKLL